MKIGVLGGTGPAGSGLAARLASCGFDVVIGSRSKYRALEVRDKLVEKWEDRSLSLSAGDNLAAAESDIVVVATPWFAKSGAEGTVTLPAAPAGRYRAEVWHWRLAQTETRELTLPAAAPVRFTLALQPDERIRRGADAATSGYR